jgi:hypothetical protein
VVLFRGEQQVCAAHVKSMDQHVNSQTKNQEVQQRSICRLWDFSQQLDAPKGSQQHAKNGEVIE